MLGISNDSRATQSAYSSSLGNIPYPILSDFHPKGKVTEQYGIFNAERGAANRSVFIVDKQGVVKFKRTYSSMDEFSMDEILGEVDKL